MATIAPDAGHRSRPARPRGGRSGAGRARMSALVLVLAVSGVAVGSPIRPAAAVGVVPAAGVPTAVTCTGGNPAGTELLAKVGPLLLPYLDGTKGSVPGLSLAVVSPTSAGGPPEVALVTCGVTERDGTDPVTTSTRFEIGSVTKTFTATALASDVVASKIALGDAVQTFVPSPYVVPSAPCGGSSATMTIKDLATHNSGLRDDPKNATWSDTMPSGRAAYNVTFLWQSFSTGFAQPCDALLFTPGTKYSYSDWGFGLLGTILADKYQPGQPIPPYGPMIADKVTGPLGLTATELEGPPYTDMAKPDCRKGVSTPCWFDNFNAFAGAGGLVSSITDMATWVGANAGFAPSSLAPAVELTHEPHGIGPDCDTCMGLAWEISPKDHHKLIPFDLLVKNGRTYGSTSQVFLAPGACWGTALLANDAVIDLGMSGVGGDVIRAVGPTSPCPSPSPSPTPASVPVPLVAQPVAVTPAFTG